MQGRRTVMLIMVMDKGEQREYGAGTGCRVVIVVEEGSAV